MEGGGDYIYVFTHIFLSFFLLQYMKKASRITNDILIIIILTLKRAGYFKYVKGRGGGEKRPPSRST